MSSQSFLFSWVNAFRSGVGREAGQNKRLSVCKLVQSSQAVFIFVLHLFLSNCFFLSLRASGHSGLGCKYGRVVDQWFMAILCSRQYSHLPLRFQKKFVTPAGAAVSCLTGQGPSPQWQPGELTLGGLIWDPHLLGVLGLVGVRVGTVLGAPEGKLLGMIWRACDRPWDGSSSPRESGKLGLMEAPGGWSNCVPMGGLLLGYKWAWGKWGGGDSVTHHALVPLKDLGGLQLGSSFYQGRRKQSSTRPGIGGRACCSVWSCDPGTHDPRK